MQKKMNVYKFVYSGGEAATDLTKPAPKVVENTEKKQDLETPNSNPFLDILSK